MKHRGSARFARLRWLCALLMAAHALCALPALAQDGRDEQWLFVPVFSAALPRDVPVRQLSRAFEAELRATGQNVLSSPDAAALFETRHSSEPVKLDSDEMTKLLQNVGQAARHLALGELPQAQQAMEGVYSLSGPARDYLNREAARARKIFDTCLMTAYLWERDHQRAQALRQMLECSRSFPGFRPEGRAYPPELREVFEQARLQLNQLPSTTLLVTSRREAACGVRLNGIEVGKSPMSFSDVRTGVTRVQLECEPGQPGRIHSVELKAGENRLDIDPNFDAAVHSQGALWLAYGGDGERAQRAQSDLAVIKRALAVTHVVALFVDGSTYPRVRVRPMFGATREIASLSYSSGEGYSPEAVVAAVKSLRKLAHPKSTAAAAEGDDAEIELASPPPPAAVPPPSPQAPSQQQLLPGIVLAVVGAGGLGAGWVLYALRQHEREQPIQSDALPLEALQNFNRRSALILGVAGAGSLVLALSDYFWEPDDPRVPVWGWVAAGVGTAVAFTGLAFSVFGQHCGPAIRSLPVACQRFSADITFGPLFAMHALPLLSIPLTYAIRIWTRPSRESLSLAVDGLDGRGAGLSLRGVF